MPSHPFGKGETAVSSSSPHHRRDTCWSVEGRTWEQLSNALLFLQPAPCTLFDRLLYSHPGTSARSSSGSRFMLFWVTAWKPWSTGQWVSASRVVMENPGFSLSFVPDQRNLAELAITKLRHVCHNLERITQVSDPFPTAWWQPTGAGWQLSLGMPPQHADTLAAGWCRRMNRCLCQEWCCGQWHAWGLYAATPYATQTLKGKANWVYLTKLLSKSAPFSWGKKRGMHY